MKVMFTLDLSEDEQRAIAHDLGDAAVASRESAQRWARQKIEAVLHALVRVYLAKRDLQDEEGIRVEDLRIERWRSTDSVADPDNAVRILHLPSRVVVESSERVSFHENRKRAMDKLREWLRLEREGLCPICHYPVNSGPCQRSHP
jgi:hypothetical protein